MIRLIVECHEVDANVGIERKDYVTLDVELPELEALLKKGGKGPMGFESWRLLGAELLPANVEVSGGAEAPAKTDAGSPSAGPQG